MKPINVYIPEDDLAKLAELVNRKLYPNRNEAIRFAIHDLVRKEA